MSVYSAMARSASPRLDERGVDDRVTHHLGLPGFEQGQGLLDVSSLHKGVDHAAERDIDREVPLLEHLIPEVPALHSMPQHAAGLDRQAICPRRRWMQVVIS